MPPAWLPQIVTLESCNGDWQRYEDLIYAQFKRDFVDHRPSFKGTRLGLRKHPVVKNRESTFWHMISEGKTEDDRIPDMRRCERIAWVRPVIEAVGVRNDVVYWEQDRHGKTNVAIALSDFSYIVFLGKRTGDTGDYLIPLTAYWVERTFRQATYRKEYEEYVKKNAPKRPTPPPCGDGI